MMHLSKWAINTAAHPNDVVETTQGVQEIELSEYDDGKN
jgi:hypothetical protein